MPEPGPLEATTLAPGTGRGPILALEAPLSFWGGVDPGTGRLIDGRHPQAGLSVAGAVLAVPSGRGSSSSSSVLAEAVRSGAGPVAIVLGEPDPIVPVGSVVAAELYGLEVPVVTLAGPAFRRLRTGPVATVLALDDGRALVRLAQA